MKQNVEKMAIIGECTLRNFVTAWALHIDGMKDTGWRMADSTLCAVSGGGWLHEGSTLRYTCKEYIVDFK